MTVAVFADTVDNDVTSAASSFTYVIGGNAKSVSYDVAPQPAPHDGQTGCNAADATPLTVNIIVPSGVTAVPSSLQFNNCDDAKTVDFTATAPGNYAISHTLSDSGTGTYTNSANFTLSVLANPLAVAVSPASPNGDNGWYDSGTISVDWTVFGGPPEPTGVSGCTDFTISADQVKTDYTCQATYGGAYGAQTFNLSTGLLGLDTLAPSVAITSPADASSTASSSITVSGTASDATSGLDEVKVNGTAVAVSSGSWSTSVSLSCGSNTINADAKDYAGHTNSASISVTRTCATYDAVGFYQPVNNILLNGAKAGATIPLKFDILLNNVEQTNTSLVVSLIQKYSCEAGATVDMLTMDELSSGSTSLRWDSTGEQFIFNWKTPKNAGCYRVTLTVDGGDSISADFQLK